MSNEFRFEVALTGPDHEPTELTKWYAQLKLVRFDQLPLGVKTYAFGPTPEKAMSELAERIRLVGVDL